MIGFMVSNLQIGKLTNISLGECLNAYLFLFDRFAKCV